MQNLNDIQTQPYGASTLVGTDDWVKVTKEFEQVMTENKYLRRELARTREQIDAIFKTIKVDLTGVKLNERRTKIR